MKMKKADILEEFIKILGVNSGIYSLCESGDQVVIVIEGGDFELTFSQLLDLKNKIGFEEMNIENRGERIYESCHDVSAMMFRMWSTK